jgi:long-chain acyl-CoA synthetase
MNLARLGDESVERFGEYVSLAFEGREWTNVEQQAAAHRFAHALRRLGLGPGDRAVVLLPNCPEVLQAYRAILALGGVIVPVVFLLSPEEVRHILADSEAKVVVTAPELLGKLDGWPGPIVLVGGGDGGLAWDDLVAGQPDRIAMVDRDDDDLAVILYTAGTTGRPKGVALSHANLASNARAAASLYELDRTEWALMVLPLSHSYGLTVMNAGHILGTKGVLLRWFNPEGVLDTIQRYRVQSMAGVPTMFVYLLNYPDASRFDTSSMRSWGSGAAPLPTEIVAPFEKAFGGRLLEGYGLTEASPVVSAHRYSGVRKLGSVGQAIPGVEIAILDDADQAAPSGEVGEVCVRGPNVMQGYYRLADETAAALRHGWLHTGDMGDSTATTISHHRAQEGPDHPGRVQRVSPRGRGGFTRTPRSPGRRGRNARCADGGRGAGVRRAQARRHPTRRASGLCQSAGQVQTPRRIRFLDSLPKSPIGKILKKELRRRAE